VTVESLDALVARLDAVQCDLESSVAAHGVEIGSVAPEHRKGADNLVRYTTLRQQDLRDLQNDLMDLGATSLSTVEPNVEAKVQAVRNVVAALRGDPGPWEFAAIDDALAEGDEILAANARSLFGPHRRGRPTRIMVTIPSEGTVDLTVFPARHAD
jgi:pyruvate kinase